MTLRNLTRTILPIAAALALTAAASAQTQVGVDIYGRSASQSMRIAVPFPTLKEPVAAAVVHEPFYSPLTRAIAYSDIFGIVAMPPGKVPSPAVAKEAGAQLYLDLTISMTGTTYVVEARLIDTNSNTAQLARRYTSSAAALTRIANTIANDLLIHFTGKPGIFLTQIAFVSTRDTSGQRVKEIYVMDWDGSNQRRITSHKSLSLSPSWSPDGSRIVYTSFGKGSTDMYIVNRDGGARQKLDTGVSLNSSPTYSPDGSKIAFVGSQRGNTDIWVIDADGKNPRRMTNDSSIESTPAWSTNGREISFTSSRSGTPQIYVMDAEGTNVRRISFDGEWNDDAVWSPDGEMIAYTSGVKGFYQIRIMNVATQKTWIIAGKGSNEQPSWAPDGRSIVFQSNRSGSWQVYRVKPDGTDIVQLTNAGENTAPDWAWSLKR
jgi:TolB protein